ncbi:MULTISPECIES: DUF5133 domain-containing protein [unclassified Streptomyces]|uniref:DUF5133 domain-containing protein n=1 Tax=unclassified Streptomyces TaxID=2593676 RepID=UPI00226DE35C|nr:MULTISPECIES: DUF5133 domain-containing protein [unclassified Streptomyces]MCY0922114.1 DUF5133 domain-containing protein [Streptomyces sp. H27-G5]MCY0962908.1 DUF5133 domain-containing protein [Streptomyces sp. H27-H5]
MSTPSGLSPDPPATQGDGRHPAPEPSTPRAVGMLMARVPCSARDARRILAAAADLAGLPVDDLALAITTTPAGSLLPTRLERALRHAIEAAHTPSEPGSQADPALVPNAARTEEALTRLRGCQARLATTPDDPAAMRAMDDAAYTLCILMGRATTHEAIAAAETQLA